MSEWKFADLPNTSVITTKKILSGQALIKYVTHDADDGGWQFLDDSKLRSLSDASIVGLGEIVNLDPSTVLLADLPLGWEAWRENRDSFWSRKESK